MDVWGKQKDRDDDRCGRTNGGLACPARGQPRVFHDSCGGPGLPALVGDRLGQGFEYKLGSGDRLRVTVFGHDDLSGEFEIGPSGTIAFPLVGEIRVSDTTLRKPNRPS